jgi:hypothetical protein
METLKFKVGDKVRVKSLEWYNGNKNQRGVVTNDIPNYVNFTAEMSRLCGKIMQVEEMRDYYYIMNESIFSWQDWMLEDEVVEDTKNRVLTKEQAQDVLRCTKYCLKNENENANLQKKLFEIGCQWISRCKTVQHTENKYLFVSENLNITTTTSREIFISSKNSELKVNEVLNIQIQDTKIEAKEMEAKEMEAIETKEMTKEQVFKYLSSTKILCTSTDETQKVQEKLFELGIGWKYNDKNVRKDKYLLFINKQGAIDYCLDIEYWIDDVNKRIEPSEILSIQLKEEEKPKFDPQTLENFQKVLYRSSNEDWWRLGFFDTYNEMQNRKFWLIGNDVQPYEQCVPYNEETKHLKGTTEKAPEFYRI